jgi:excisionase family DNA binding protein
MSTTAETTARYMGYREASAYSSLSVGTLRRLVESGRLRVYRPTGARKILFDKVELDQLVHSCAANSDHE